MSRTLQTLELEGNDLDVACALGFPDYFYVQGYEDEDTDYSVFSKGENPWGEYESPGELVFFRPSTSWYWAGPILNDVSKEVLIFEQDGYWHCQLAYASGLAGARVYVNAGGKTKLIALCRAYAYFVNGLTITFQGGV